MLRRSPLAPMVLIAFLFAVVFGPTVFVPSGSLWQRVSGSSSEAAWGLRRPNSASGRFRLRSGHALETDLRPSAMNAGGEPMSLVASPKEAYFTLVEKGEYNAKMSPIKILHQSIMGGMFLGFGGLLSLSIAGNIGAAASGNPGLVKYVFAALFPVNLMLILLTGAQLFTGNSATVPAAVYEGRATWGELVKSWVISTFGNIVSCFIFACATKYSGLLVDGTAELAVATCLKKTHGAFGPTLVKAIGANWLVCMAVFLSGQARDMAGKILGIWWPISTFVAIGLEHSVANMFLLPVGILAGAKVSVAQMIIKNWIPVLLGNAIAGAVCVAASYSYAFGKLGGNN